MRTDNTRRVLLARIGWMNFYRGIVPADSELIGGGKYNETQVGNEELNFAPFKDRMSGFVQGVRSHPLALERISDLGAGLESLDNVLVIFVSKRPNEAGQVVIGWYHNAIVHSDALPDPRRSRRERYFNVETDTMRAVLLPTNERRQPVPGGAGGFGQANVCYPLQKGGIAKPGNWMRGVIRYVDGYSGANLISHPDAEAENQAAEQAEAVAAASQGQGFASSPQQRQAIEQHAMARARAHFRARFDVVSDTSNQKGVLDLCCSTGAKRIRVEVKGTTTNGESVMLTRREVERARSGNCALFVLHSIKLSGNNATGGTERVIDDWKIQKDRLLPVSYTYKLS
jgi:hypothetical protein